MFHTEGLKPPNDWLYLKVCGLLCVRYKPVDFILFEPQHPHRLLHHAGIPGITDLSYQTNKIHLLFHGL